MTKNKYATRKHLIRLFRCSIEFTQIPLIAHIMQQKDLGNNDVSAVSLTTGAVHAILDMAYNVYGLTPKEILTPKKYIQYGYVTESAADASIETTPEPEAQESQAAPEDEEEGTECNEGIECDAECDTECCATAETVEESVASDAKPEFPEDWDDDDISRFKTVKTMLSKQLDIDSNRIKPESKLVDNLGMDSLDSVELLLAVEDKFAVEVPDEKISNTSTVYELCNVIREMVTSKGV